jgi:hypothetical protein
MCRPAATFSEACSDLAQARPGHHGVLVFPEDHLKFLDRER